jgi:hypothetical protein
VTVADDRQKLNDQLNKLCKYWNKRKTDLKSWETTPDHRLQFHIVISYFGSHNVYLVFKRNVSQPDAQLVLDPILKRLSDDNAKGQCSAFASEVDMTALQRVVDFDRTVQANQ